MNFSIRVTAASMLLTLFSHAQAHDPAEHAREAAEARKGADCSTIDHRTMDPNDPVAQALMAKCGMHEDAAAGHDGHGSSAAQTPEAGKAPKASDHHGAH
jgi:hypothetical protein